MPVLHWINITMVTLEITLGEDVEEYVGGVSRERNGLGYGHILASKRLIFFLAVINSSLVRRRRIDIYSANIR